MSVPRPADPDYLKGAALAFAAASIWAGWSVLTRLAVTTGIDAADVAALRFGVAGVLLAPVVLRRGLARERLGWSGLAVIIAGLGPPYVLAAAAGLRFAPASDQGALNPGCMPLFTALIAACVVGERFSPAAKSGLSLILAGALVIVVRHGWSVGWGAGRVVGDALFLAAAFLSAAFTVAMRQARLDPLHAAALVSSGSLVLYLPFYLASRGTGLTAMPLPDLAMQALFQGVVVTIVGVVLYGRAVALLGAARGAAWCRCCPGSSRSRSSASGRSRPIGWPSA